MHTIAQRARRTLAVLFVALLAAVSLTGCDWPASTPTAPSCPTGWTASPKSDTTMGTGEVDGLRTGRHECFDRLVIDIDGPAAGYHVEYVDEVTQDGSGFPVAVKGGARLQVIVRHPSFSTLAMPSVAGFTTFRDVKPAGSFEGQTTFGLGVREELPFAVTTLQGGHSRIVIDVKHTR